MRIQRRFATIPTVSSNKAWRHLFLRLKFTYLSKTSRAVFVTCDEKHSHRVWVWKRNKWPGGVPGGWGNFWGRGKLLMIPLFAFGWESAFGKKSSLWSRWKLIFIDASCRIGFTAPPALYHISFVCQQHIFAIKTPMEFIFKSMDSSLCWKKILHLANWQLG